MAVRRRAATEQQEPVVRAARLAAALGIPLAIAVGLLLVATLLRGLDPASTVAFLWAAAVTPLFVSALNDQSVLIVRGAYLQVAVLQSALPITSFLVVVTGWLTDRLDVAWVVSGQGLGAAVTGVAGLVFVRVSLRGERSSVHGLAREGAKYSGSQISETAQNRLDQVLMPLVIGASGAGLYAVAVTVATLPLALGHALAAALFRDVAAADDAGRVSLTSRAVRESNVLGIVAAGALAAVTPFVIPLVFGEDFRAAVPVTLVALIGAPLFVTGYVATNLLGAHGRGHAMTFAQLSGLVVGLILLVPLAVPFGAVGAAAASVLGYAVSCTLAVRGLRIPAADLRPRRHDARGAIRDLLG